MKIPENTSLEVYVPAWLSEIAQEMESVTLSGQAAKMRFVIDLARRNVEEKTGGPFGAAIFEANSNELIAFAVNNVVADGLSIAHAETLATMWAQRKLATHDLASEPDKKYELFTSGQPCIMCFGVTWWSGVTRLVCAARGEDIEKIVGFKEGPLPENWADLLRHREGLPDIEVIQDVLRDEACEVLQLYAQSGQPVYNAGEAV